MVETTAQIQASAQQDVGVGSIWNKNSWHWEERNYSELAKKYLEQNLIKIEVVSTENPPAKIRLYEVKSIEGSASITIRKQKQIFLFDYKLDIYFDAVHLTDPETKAMGRVTVDEFNQDDDDIDMDIVAEKKEEFVYQVKNSLSKLVKPEILRVVNELKAELKKIDASEEKIRKDQIEREQALKNYQQAEQDKGDVKQQLFEEQKKKEAEMKEQARILIEQQKSEQPQKVQKVEGQGSVWNTGSYFWEEKSVGKWADERIKEVIGGFAYNFSGGVIKITSVEKIKGEASVSIRKGKKIVSYDYNAVLKWELSAKDGEGNEVANLKGQYELPEVSNDIADDGEDWEVRTSVKEDKGQNKARFDKQIRQEAPKELRKAIMDQFVSLLQQK
ncbi:activator of hsp90 [Stylonychia lemnae]|uniref:Activator of hsp90 n=1 Tax=Stylonychia lemnae TaxID=5949 RepID=A0A078BCA5_STYLE|nr:activator of hsp90 [Stylonychia lemnae]|eukprot:CDW91228.1 activator of hsp90 [Stylonychia lemnae]